MDEKLFESIPIMAEIWEARVEMVPTVAGPERIILFGVGCLVDVVEWYLEHQDWVEEVITGEYLEYYREIYGQG